MFNKAYLKKENKVLPRTLINRPTADCIHLTFLNFLSEKYSSKNMFNINHN